MDSLKSYRSDNIFGTVVISAKNLRNFLKKSHYFMSYDTETASFSLCVNDGCGGRMLLRATSVPYESAKRFAEELGLAGNGDSPLEWSKWNPTLTLYHDGSSDGNELEGEILKLGIPYKKINGSELSLGDGRFRYTLSMHSKEYFLKIIRETAERFREQLQSIP